VGGEEGDLPPERVLAPLRLTGRLSRADHDVPHLELTVRVAGELSYSHFTFYAADRLPEREHVGRPVLPAVSGVERAHRLIAHERDGDPRVGGQRVRLHRGTDRAADRCEVARRVTAERELQVPEALVGGAAAGGRRAMRSSGYGIRS